MFALVDCNNFYASCERVFDPGLEGKPLIVLSNNDGCAIARSDEAKAAGVQMGMPAYMLEDIIRAHNVKVFSSNYTLYGDMSNRIMKILAGFSPATEMYSIDEAFLDLSHLKFNDLFQMAVTIRKTIIQYTGIPVSIGIAPSKTLAKMSNRYAKKKHKPIGVFHMANQDLINEVLTFTEVGDVWGIGKQHERLLRGHNIKTAMDLSRANDEWIRKNLSVVGQRMVNELRGIPCIKFDEDPPAKKAICNSRSFGTMVTDKDQLQEAISNYAANVALKLRNQKSCTRQLHLFIQTNPFRTDEKQYFRSIDMELPVATNSSNELITLALKALDIIFKPGFKYLKAGVLVQDIIPETEIQKGIFDTVDRGRNKIIMTAIDQVNRSLGKDLVRFGRQGFDKKWKLRAAHRSPHYTTNANELLTIKI